VKLPAPALEPTASEPEPEPATSEPEPAAFSAPALRCQVTPATVRAGPARLTMLDPIPREPASTQPEPSTNKGCSGVQVSVSTLPVFASVSETVTTADARRLTVAVTDLALRRVGDVLNLVLTCHRVMIMRLVAWINPEKGIVLVQNQ